MDDEEIIEHISQVSGIGRWTVEMMLLFRLGRPNVLPVDDYGVRKGMQRLYKLRELPNKDAMRRRARKWEPWCSVASWYMWRCAELPGSKPRTKAETETRSEGSRKERKPQRKSRQTAALEAAASELLLLQAHVESGAAMHVWLEFHGLQFVVLTDVNKNRLLGNLGQVGDFHLSIGAGEGFEIELLCAHESVADSCGDLGIVDRLGIGSGHIDKSEQVPRSADISVGGTAAGALWAIPACAETATG